VSGPGVADRPLTVRIRAEAATIVTNDKARALLLEAAEAIEYAAAQVAIDAARVTALEAENEKLGRAYGERCRLAHEREDALKAVLTDAHGYLLACIGDDEGRRAVQRGRMLTLTAGQVAALAEALGLIDAGLPDEQRPYDHDCADHVVQAGEGTAYCSRCEMEAANPEATDPTRTASELDRGGATQEELGAAANPEADK